MAILADYLTVPLDTIIAPQLVDTATGAYNKEHFMQRLREEMARARRQDYFLSVAVFDLDHAGGLKGVRSPEARAELLRKATVFLQQYLREEDLLAHFGDALFALLLPDVSQDVAKKLATRLQTRMAWAPFELERAGVRVNLACGVGVASLAEETTDPDELVESARKNLQRAGAPNYGVTDQFEEDLIVEDLRLQEQ
jgi:diguanylate cyclase (GGDEF)-like protein